MISLTQRLYFHPATQRGAGQGQISSAQPISITIDVAAAITEERASFDSEFQAQNFAAILARYPVRETPALDRITTALGFQNRKQYQEAVRKLIIDDADALTAVRSLFGSLYEDITSV